MVICAGSYLPTCGLAIKVSRRCIKGNQQSFKMSSEKNFVENTKKT